jgi:hypothetical protein
MNSITLFKRNYAARERKLIANPSMQRSERRRFKDWLLCNRRAARQHPFGELLATYPGNISLSSAYRVALTAGLRGARRNHSKYAAFWEGINWELSDAILAAVWNVSRGNIRQRRLRLGVGTPRFAARNMTTDPHFIEAVTQEKQHAEHYNGPRPQ